MGNPRSGTSQKKPTDGATHNTKRILTGLGGELSKQKFNRLTAPSCGGELEAAPEERFHAVEARRPAEGPYPLELNVSRVYLCHSSRSFSFLHLQARCVPPPVGWFQPPLPRLLLLKNLPLLD